MLVPLGTSTFAGSACHLVYWKGVEAIKTLGAQVVMPIHRCTPSPSRFVNERRQSRSFLESWSTLEMTGSLEIKESPSSWSSLLAPAGVRSHAEVIVPRSCSRTTMIGNSGTSSVLMLIFLSLSSAAGSR